MNAGINISDKPGAANTLLSNTEIHFTFAVAFSNRPHILKNREPEKTMGANAPCEIRLSSKLISV
jgi:hypothetical protein